jgi:multidrug efflux pump subunit AcrA (membrane-fusion protein)
VVLGKNVPRNNVPRKNALGRVWGAPPRAGSSVMKASLASRIGGALRQNLGRGRPLAALCGLGALAVALVVLGPGRSPQASTRPAFRYPVEVIELSQRALRPELELSGRVEAGARQSLIAAFDGWIVRVEVRPGQPVSAGGLLAVLRPERLQDQLAAARLDIETVDTERTELQQRERYLRQRLEIEREALVRLIEVRDNAAGLRARAVITVMDYEVHHAAADSRRLQVLDIERELRQLPLELRRLEHREEKLRLDVASFEQQLAQAELRAPVDAVVTSVDIEPGAHVQNGLSLITLAPREALRVVVPWPERAAAGADTKAYALIAQRALPLQVERIVAQIESGRASPQAWLRPEGHAQSLVLGSHLQVRLQLPSLQAAFAVPEAALYDGGRVFRLDPQGGSLAAVAADVVGQRYDSEGRLHWILRSPDLQAGDRLLVSRLSAASDGLPVDARLAAPLTAQFDGDDE